MSKKILFITNVAPWSDCGGGGQRTALLLEALQAMAEVDVFICRYGEDEMSAAELSRNEHEAAKLGCRVAGQFFLRNKPVAAPKGWLAGMPPKLMGGLSMLQGIYNHFQPDLAGRAAIEKVLRATAYAAAVIRYPVTALRLGLDAVAGACPMLLDVDDVPWRVVRSEANARADAKLATRLLDEARFVVMHQATRRRLLAFDYLWVAKSSDVDIGRKGRASVLPNIPFGIKPGSVEPTPAASAPRIMMVGSFWYRPNREGLLWFLRNVWPEIRDRVSDCEFVIVGVSSESLANEPELQGRAGIRIAGQVADLAPEYQASHLTIAPIFTGGGTKIKVLESLAYGRPCVAASHAVEGFEQLQAPGSGVSIADDPSGFAAHCIRLLKNPSEAALLGRCGRELVERFWSKETFFAAVHQPLRALMAAPRVKGR